MFMQYIICTCIHAYVECTYVHAYIRCTYIHPCIVCTSCTHSDAHIGCTYIHAYIRCTHILHLSDAGVGAFQAFALICLLHKGQIRCTLDASTSMPRYAWACRGIWLGMCLGMPEHMLEHDGAYAWHVWEYA